MNENENIIANDLAKNQKSISVAEFFEKNRQILGFDSAPRSLITIVKEAVDNSLDACEESGILPDITVQIKNSEKKNLIVIIEDNGPGIVKKQIPKVFGKLLYGSKFHALKQSRVQPSDIVEYDLSTDKLTEKDVASLRSELEDPRFQNKYWEKQIRLQLDINKKAEQQAFAGKGLDFVTNTYLPERLTELGIL